MGRGAGSWAGTPVRHRHHDRLANLDPLEFERVVADYYRRQGYAVEHCGTGGGPRRFDGGVDLKMHRDGEYTVVQCKRENVYQVTHNVGHELLGILLTEKADRAIVVNAGEFTNYAWQSAAKEPRLQLIDGNRLREMLPDYAAPVVLAGDGAGARAPIDCPRFAPASRPAPSGKRSGRARRDQGQNGWKALVALMLLVAVVLAKCVVPDPPEPKATNAPVPSVKSPGPMDGHRLQPSRQSGSAPTEADAPTMDAAEARRRADEAIRVIEATTPEMYPSPDPHAVHGN